MKTPGFTAELSLVRSGRHYATNAYRAGRPGQAGQVRASTDNDAVCCSAQCGGSCYCQGGIGHCIPIVEASAARSAYRLADVCTSGDGLSASACACGCVAGPTSTSCLACTLPPDGT